MIYLAGFLAVAVFVAALDASGIEGAAARAMDTSRGATEILRDGRLSDQEKEKAMRKASSSLLVSFLSIGFRGALAVAASLLVLALFHLLGLATFSSVTGWLSQGRTILLMTVLVIAWFLARRRW
jgi:hypothetical protein